MAADSAVSSRRASRPTPISIIGMSGLREIITVSSSMAALFAVAAMFISGAPLTVLAMVFGGFLFWTFLEYLLHRWVLHWEPERPIYKIIRKCFPSHRSHHDAPKNERKNIRLQLKIVVYLTLVYTAFLWLIGIPIDVALAVNAGVLIGYQAYEYVHVACHHLPMRNSWAALLKHHHAIHHHCDETVNFGVTTTVWDSVFRTTYRPTRTRENAGASA